MSRTLHHARMRYKLSSHMHWSPEPYHASLSGSAWKSPMQSMWCRFALIYTRVGKAKMPPEPNGVFPVRTCLKCAPCGKGQLQMLSSPKSPDARRVHVWKRLIFNERNLPAVSITHYSHLHPKTVLLTGQNTCVILNQIMLCCTRLLIGVEALQFFQEDVAIGNGIVLVGHDEKLEDGPSAWAEEEDGAVSVGPGLGIHHNLIQLVPEPQGKQSAALMPRRCAAHLGHTSTK